MVFAFFNPTKSLERLPPLPPLTEDIIYAFGLIVTEWVAIEDAMGRIVAKTFCNKKNILAEVVITNQMGFKQRKDVIKIYGSLLNDPEEQKELVRIISKIESLAEIRDHIAHHHWVKSKKNPDRIKAFYAKAKGKLRLRGHRDDEKEYSYSDFMKTAGEIRKLWLDLSDWTDKYLKD